MKTTQRLVQLLATLQPDEKRQINKVLDRAGDGTQARQLYEALLKHLKEDEYGRATLNIDEEQLINRLHRDGIKPTQFHVVRNNLQNIMMKALRQLSEDHNKADEIRIFLRDAQILEGRGMFDWAEELLKKALEIANKYQYAALSIEALHRLVTLNIQMSATDYVEKMNRNLNDLDRLAENYREEIQLFAKWHHSFLLYKIHRGINNEDLNGKIRNLLTDQRLVEPESIATFMGRLAAYHSRSLLADLTEGYGAAHGWHETILELWQKEEHRHLKEAHGALFIKHVSNYLAYCLATEKYEAYLKHISLLENFKAGNLNDRADLFHALFYVKQLYFLNTGQFQEGRELIPATLKGLTKYAFKINKARLLSLIYNILFTYFVLGDYAAMLKRHKETTPMWMGTDLRRDLQTAIRFFELIAQIELDDYEAMEKFLKQVKPNLDTEIPDPDFERIVLIHLVALADTIVNPLRDAGDNEKKEKEILKNFYARLLQFQKDLAPQSIAGLQEIIYWLQTKNEGGTFLEKLLKK